jgi:hypothetical protein
MLICSNVKGALLGEPLSHSKSYSVRRTHLKTSSTMSSFVPHAHHCRRNLANFFLSLADEPAQSYLNLYVPFMRHCGLVRESRSNKYSNNITLQPAIEGNFYTWSDFIAEYSLCIKTTFVYELGSKRRRYFVCVGKF